MATITYSDVADRDLTDSRLLHCRRLGLAGSVALLVGGVFAGMPPSHDALLQQPALKAVRGFVTPTVMLVYIGLCLLMLAWWRLGRLVRSGDGPSPRELAVTLAWWSAPLLVTMPIFSRDVYSYIAQGTMTVLGVDAYHFGPQVFGGPLAVDIPVIWQTTPAPYGPVFLSLAADVASITGETSWLGVVGMRLLALVGIALMFFAIPRLARLAGIQPSYAIWLGVPTRWCSCTSSPTLATTLMIGLMMAGLTARASARPPPGAGDAGWAHQGAAGLALISSFRLGQPAHGPRQYVRAALGVGGAGVATAVATTTLAGTGYGWVGALTRQRWPTPTPITTDVGYWTGPLAEHWGTQREPRCLRGGGWPACRGRRARLLMMHRTRIRRWASVWARRGAGAPGPVVHPLYPVGGGPVGGRGDHRTGDGW
jgi:hypothetical protein